MPYLYDVYSSGFDMNNATSLRDVIYPSVPPYRAHHYQEFEKKRGRKIIGEFYNYFRSNLIMFDNP